MTQINRREAITTAASAAALAAVPALRRANPIGLDFR